MKSTKKSGNIYRLKPVGLTGGIASGKTTVANMFRQIGAHVLDGDQIAAEVMSPGSEALNCLAKIFGENIINPDGTLNRSKMLNFLLKDHRNMDRQLQVLKPYILPEIDKRVSDFIDMNPSEIIMVEAPLLFEYEEPQRYHPIITVFIPKYLQIKRLMARSGQPYQWAEKVVHLQIDINIKSKRSDYVVDNSGTKEETLIRVKKIFEQISDHGD